MRQPNLQIEKQKVKFPIKQLFQWQSDLRLQRNPDLPVQKLKNYYGILLERLEVYKLLAAHHTKAPAENHTILQSSRLVPGLFPVGNPITSQSNK